MIINIDIDNTVNNFARKVIDTYNKLYNDSVSYEDVTSYDFLQLSKIPFECLEELFFKNDHFYEELEPIQDSVEQIECLVDNGHNVKFVSAADYSIVKSRVDFIKRYFPYLDVNDSLILTRDKHNMWADVVVDDYPKNLTNINWGCKFILFDAPWNRHIDTDAWVTNAKNLNNCARCSTWESVVDVIFQEELDRKKKLAMLVSKWHYS
jgi:5'-nucleotidase